MGIIDAEGCFYINRKAKYNRVAFNITNQNHRILYLFQEFFGFGGVYLHTKGTVNSCHTWNIGSKHDLKIFVEFIEEYGPKCSEHHNPLLVKMVNRPRPGHPPTTWEEWVREAKAYYNRADLTVPLETIQEYLKKSRELRKTGMFYKDIAQELGINPSNLSSWRRKYDPQSVKTRKPYKKRSSVKLEVKN